MPDNFLIELADRFISMLNNPELMQRWHKFHDRLEGCSLETRGFLWPVLVQMVESGASGVAGQRRALEALTGSPPAAFAAALERIKRERIKGLRVEDDGYITIIEWEEV